ncbi:hypothetical protein GGH92_010786, partial [Coemansia sp. RSA 2673]
MDELLYEPPMQTVCASNYYHTVNVILYDKVAGCYKMDWFSADNAIPYEVIRKAYIQDMATFLITYGSSSYMFGRDYRYLGMPHKTHDLNDGTIIVFTSGIVDTGNAQLQLEHLVNQLPRK